MTDTTEITGITPIPANFNGTPVTIIERDGQHWLTAEEVGKCLGYNAANARDGIIKLCNRHADEFSEADTCTVKLTAQGQMREMRVFSATGCVILGWMANTKKAKQFRDWAKAVLARHMGQPSPALPAPDEHPANALVVKIWAEVDALHTQLSERDGQITRLLADQAQAMLSQQYQINGLQGQLIGSQARQIRLMGTVQSMQRGRAARDAKHTMVQMAREGKSRDQIVAATGRTHNHVRQILFQARAAGALPPLVESVSSQTTLFAEAA